MSPSINNLFDLKGKKAIVTGVTGSIGFACAEVLFAYGATLVLVGRNVEKLADAKEKLMSQCSADERGENDATNKTTSGTHEKLICECIDFNDLVAMEQLFLKHSDADIFLNSVGINIPESILDVSEEHYDTIMDTNVKSAFFQTQFYIRARLLYTNQTDPTTNADSATVPTSSLIHISSQMAFVGGDKRNAYCASKHALQGFCKATALEIGQWNMRINTISPTFIENEFAKTTLSDPKMKKLITDSIVFGRMGQTEDLYGATIFLASDSSKFITGSSITVDGGWTAR